MDRMDRMDTRGVGEEPWPLRGRAVLPGSLCPRLVPPSHCLRVHLDGWSGRSGPGRRLRSGGDQARAAPRPGPGQRELSRLPSPSVLISGRQLLGITLTEWFCLPAFSTVRRPRAMDQRRGSGVSGSGGGAGRGPAQDRPAIPPPLSPPPPPPQAPEPCPAPAWSPWSRASGQRGGETSGNERKSGEG